MRLVMNATAGNWSRLGGVAGLALALALLGTTGCASMRYRSEAQAQQDQALAQTVRDALAASPVYKYSDVHVTVDRGTVDLNGVVPTLAQKRAAEVTVEQVPGVLRVDNDLSVQPLPGSPEFGVNVPPPTPPY
jgi:osmotically-inducible protein OsmY